MSWFHLLTNSSLLVVSFLCLFRPSFAARPMPDTTTGLTTGVRNSTWMEYGRFRDAEKGGWFSGIHRLKRYFHRYGYLQNHDTSNITDTFDTELESAIFSYQSNFGLPATGELDSDTLSLITSPRCGVSDKKYKTTERVSHATKHYTLFEGKPRWVYSEFEGKPTWVENGSTLNLTYAFSPTNTIDYIDPGDLKAVFKSAFARWAQVIPVSFQEVEGYPFADIVIGFYYGDHGDGTPFHGLAELAHADEPMYGLFHLNAAQRWAIDFDKEKARWSFDLESVATHEIGHLLGLDHSPDDASVMYPYLDPRVKKRDLALDDVEGVQALYGANPKFNISSLLETTGSSRNMGTGLKTRLSKWICSLVVGTVVMLL